MSMKSPTHISVLGGGLTGLSSTFHLARRFPLAKITLLERSSRPGGWVNSERVQVRDEGGNEASILLEQGPRTLRPNSKAVLELINLLNLMPSLLTVPKTAPAAQTRFLHIPGTQGLTALPSALADFATSSLGRAMVRAGMREPFRLYSESVARLQAEDGDESLDQFLAARLGPELSRILGSSLAHGIYAADSRVLSVRAAFPSVWSLATSGRGSIARGMLRNSMVRGRQKIADDYDLGDVPDIMKTTSVFSFRDGMATLVNAMEKALLDSPNVNIIRGESVAKIEKASQDSGLVLHTSSGRSIPSTHLISAIPLPALHTLLNESSLSPFPHLTANPTSSVSVVNLVFPPTAPDQPIHPPGFGYLIPRDTDGNAPVLGTVFDSCSLGGQDIYASDTAPRFTKMTMMIPLQESSAPVTQDTVLAHLTSHLRPRTPLPPPVLFRAHAQRACIPTPTVGHLSRTRELRDAATREWGGCLEVVGAGVGGVSVGDCIEQGRNAGRAWSS